MDKAGLRAQIRHRRSQGHTPSPDVVARVLAQTPRGVVCCYVALPGEPPTDDLIEALLARGDEVYLPIATDTLHWTPAATSRPWRAWGLRPGPVPDAVEMPDPDAVIVPALAVDSHGRRLGQGGGYYDRFLPTVTARTIALIWHDEVLEHVPTEPHDITVNAWVIADE
jgi:5-formyltetrahydrofolate cyclo-ligase